MATHSSVVAWRIPGTGEPGGLRGWWVYEVAQSRTRLKCLSSSSSSSSSSSTPIPNAVTFLYVCLCVYVIPSVVCVQLFVTPWTVARQAPLSKEFSR